MTNLRQFAAERIEGRLRIRFSSEFAHVDQAVTAALAFCLERQPSIGDLDEFGLRLLLHETLINAVKHGNRQLPEKQVYFEVAMDDNALDFVVRDEGSGFDLSAAPARWDGLQESGRGLMLIRAYADSVRHNAAGNEVRVRKRFDFEG